VTRPPRGPGRRAEEACAGPARGPRDRAHPVVSVAGILHVRQRVGVDRRVREASARRDVAHVHAQRHRLEEPVGQVLVDEFAPTRRQDVGVERSTTVLPDQRHDRAFGVQVTAPQRHLVEHLVHRVGHDPQLVPTPGRAGATARSGPRVGGVPGRWRSGRGCKGCRAPWRRSRAPAARTTSGAEPSCRRDDPRTSRHSRGRRRRSRWPSRPPGPCCRTAARVPGPTAPGRSAAAPETRKSPSRPTV
jgi:hypothetical protein